MVKVSVPISLEQAPNEVQSLLNEREQARTAKDFARSDALRQQISELGYLVNDQPVGFELLKIGDEEKKLAKSYLVLFGSGENAPSAADTYRQLFLSLDKRNLRIALVTSPAGFQPNVALVYQEIKDYLLASLPDFNLTIDIVFANNREQANDEKIASMIDGADIIFTGPGSPTYAVKILKDTLVYSRIKEQVKKGSTLILASAATIAFSRYALPVYEIYKVGEDLHWQDGLNFYQDFWQEITIIPHFNNREGGVGLDTSHCYIGESRFKKMKALLPTNTPMLGIDEHTVCTIDLGTKNVTSKGKGVAHKV